jgi:O-acetyl-ADP-ribose deacetylase (regulator of RNase III)
MIKFAKGDLLKANSEALVNTVNTVGVMGKGIALQFKEAFPYNHKRYIEACKNKSLDIGKLLAVRDTNLLLGTKLIINFPTKKHWRQPSRYEYIKSGLESLITVLRIENVKSVAIPPLGCGNGGLDWNVVKKMLIDSLGSLDIEVILYEPNAAIKAQLQKENKPKDTHLTTARAQLLFTLFVYESFGENSSLFAANKLAYFLQRMGQPMRLQFQRNSYGPYAIGVQKVLYELNGVYLKGLEQQQVKPFEPLHLNYEKWFEVKDFIDTHLEAEQRTRLMSLVHFISGFTSELSLEILSSVAFVLDDHPDASYDEVKTAIRNWSERKRKLFTDEYLQVAYQHLLDYRLQGFPKSD